VSQAVIDTTVASILHIGSPHQPFYVERIDGFELYVSFQTVEEMLFGAYRARWGGRRITALHDFLQSCSVMPGTWEVAETSARVRIEAERLGRRLECEDAWIVATAVYLQLPLITDDADQVIRGLSGYTCVSRHGVSP
jgi:predicted nucleic acid-binding protein